MAAWQVVTLGLLAAAAASASPTRIAGGEETNIQNYPSVVQVEYLGVFSQLWSQSCVATIINSLYLVSAAHCFDGWDYRQDWRRFRAGSTHRNAGGVMRQLAYRELHQDYRPPRFDADIAVIRVDEPFVYTPVVQPARIMNQGAELDDDTKVIQVGWGRSVLNGLSNSELQSVSVKTIDRALCRQRYAPVAIVTDNMICSGLLNEGGKGACNDDGAPLFYDDDVLIGVASWGEECGNPRYPSVSTRIASYSSWIIENAK